MPTLKELVSLFRKPSSQDVERMEAGDWQDERGGWGRSLEYDDDPDRPVRDALDLPGFLRRRRDRS